MPVPANTEISFEFVDGGGLKGARQLIDGLEETFFDMRHYSTATRFGDTGVTVSAISETGGAGLVGMALGDGVGVRGSDDTTQQRRSIEGGEALVFALGDLPAGTLATSLSLELTNVSGSGEVMLTFLTGGVETGQTQVTPVAGVVDLASVSGGYDEVQIAATGGLGFEVGRFSFAATDPGAGGDNRAPTAADDDYVVDQDGALVITADGVLGNDSDPDGDLLNAVLVTDVGYGLLTLGLDGGFEYVPTEGFVGTDSFIYRAEDPDGAFAEATVTIEVEAIAEPPTGVVARLDFLDDANGTRNLDYFEDGVLLGSEAQRTFETVRTSTAGDIRLTAEDTAGTVELSLRGDGLGVRAATREGGAERTTLNDTETILVELLAGDAFDLSVGVHDSRGAGDVTLDFFSDGVLVEQASVAIETGEAAHTLSTPLGYDAVRIGVTGDLAIELADLEYATGEVPVLLAPAPTLLSGITLELGPAIQLAAPSNFNNFAAPVAIGVHLYVINQFDGISVWDGTGSQVVVDATNLPTGVTPTGREAYLNVAGSGDTVYVAFTSSSRPDGLEAAQLPDDPAVNISEQLYQVIVGYTRAADGSLSAAEPIAAFERAASGPAGGGMLELPDGTILFATGDGIAQSSNGLTYAQDANEHVGSLLIIDPNTGEVETAATGVRNVQRLTYVEDGVIGFADIGWTVSEEINRIDVTDLMDLTEVENFGWGIAADGLAREGSFYVNDGVSDAPAAIGLAPLGEAGFIQPYAEVGRTDPDTFFAGSGPVASASLGPDIELLFGDLVSGALYATAPGGADVLNDVYDVALVDMLGNPVVMDDLTPDVRRAELRFFNFADGEAGLFLERQGTAHELTFVSDEIFV